MSTSPPSILVHQLAALHQEYPTDEIVAFVPRRQLGMALETALTQSSRHVAGVTATTVSDYANAWAALPLQKKGGQPLTKGAGFFLTEMALRRIDDRARSALLGDRSLAALTAPLAKTFDTLRRHHLSSANYRESTPSSERHRALADAYSAYEKLLTEHSYYDTAQLLRTAARAIRPVSSTLHDHVFVLQDGVELSVCSKTFLDALFSPQDGTAPPAFRLGTNFDHEADDTTQLSAPPNRGAAQYPDLPYPTAAPKTPSLVGRLAVDPGIDVDGNDVDGIRCWTATGVRREIQAVFEDIIAENRPLDTVEIAFTSREPYLAHLDALAERYELPVSRSPGRALSATRPGQALQGFFDWIADGVPAEQLIHLLRSGLLRVDEPNGPDGKFGQLDSARAATLLAQRRYGDPWQESAGYESTLENWIAELRDELKDLQGAATEAPWLAEAIQKKEEKKAAVQAVKTVVGKLLKWAHFKDRNQLEPKLLSDGAQRLIEALGPTPKPTESEEERTADQAARNRLMERLQTLEDMEGLRARPLRRLATQMSSWIELEPFIRAEKPEPGRARIVPLESAGYANREHLYVVGLDATSTLPQLTDDPLLTDEDRDALSTEDQSLPLYTNRADTDAWLTARALARHRGTVTLSASTYDLTEDDEVFEAPLFLRIREALEEVTTEVEEDTVTHFPVSVQSERALSLLDRWTQRNTPSTRTVQRSLDAKYPWMSHGLQAERARASDTYTVYDGLLDAPDHSDLNPLAHSTPISPGRLETYARAPYAYFLRYVLDVEPLDEPALDDVAWLDARDRGAVLHDTFYAFMTDLDRQPIPSDESDLKETFSTVLTEKRDQIPPPSEVVFAATKRQLWNDARIFLHAEASRTDPHTPEAFEFGFGLPPHRITDGDRATAPPIDLVDPPFQIRGRIDRIDRHSEDRVSLWDYKTGSSRSFEKSDLLDGGRHLQWVLYAYAYEALEGKTVDRAGYFFTSTGEMGRRLSASPRAARPEVAQVLRRIGVAISAGGFPINDGDDLRYSFESLFQDFSSRQSELTAKEWPDDRPPPPHLAEE